MLNVWILIAIKTLLFPSTEVNNCVLNGVSTALSESSSICSDLKEVSETEVMNSISCTFDDPFDFIEESWHHVSSLLNMANKLSFYVL